MVAISLCVLLLATYCYSVPVIQRSSTTPDYEFTTGHTMVDHNNRINMHLMTDAESTGVPSLHQPRTVGDSDSKEYTTSVPYGEHISHVPRTLNESSTMDPAEATFLRNFNKFQFTTMENKSQFQKKAIGPAETESEEAESKRDFAENDLEAEDSESKRDFRETDSEEKEPESKRTVSENDSEDKDTETESKRAMFGDDFEATTYSFLSGSPTTTYQSINAAEKVRQQPTTTYQSINAAESRENFRQQPTTTYRSMNTAENSREQPSANYQSMNTAESRDNFRQQPTTTYRSMNTAENSREQPSSVDSFGRNTGFLRKQQPKRVQMTRPVDQSNEEFTTQPSQILRQRPIVTKTETIFPVKVTETKYFVPKQPVAETPKSDN